MPPMASIPLRALALVTTLVALPAAATWEELRRNDQFRLSIDPRSIKREGSAVAFRYLIDFRQPQGDYKTAVYRSLVTKAHIRCGARTIVTVEAEAFPGVEAKGPPLGVIKPGKGEDVFKKLEAGTSDEDLYKRVCEGKKSAPPKK
jgi:hypothetical protein